MRDRFQEHQEHRTGPPTRSRGVPAFHPRRAGADWKFPPTTTILCSWGSRGRGGGAGVFTLVTVCTSHLRWVLCPTSPTRSRWVLCPLHPDRAKWDDECPATHTHAPTHPYPDNTQWWEHTRTKVPRTCGFGASFAKI